MQKLLTFAKASHIFSTKNIGVSEILTFEILTKHYTTNDVSFKHLGPGVSGRSFLIA